jgi:hypothetical protein
MGTVLCEKDMTYATECETHQRLAGWHGSDRNKKLHYFTAHCTSNGISNVNIFETEPNLSL